MILNCLMAMYVGAIFGRYYLGSQIEDISEEQDAIISIFGRKYYVERIRE